MNREGQTEKWQSKELGSSYAPKSVMKVDRIKKKFFLELWKLTKGIQQLDKHLLRINNP